MGTWSKTDFKGVRFRKHKTRKHGVQPDRYYAITYWWGGKTVTEAVGWASEGVKPSTCFELLSQLKKNQKTGQGPVTLVEMRAEGEAERKAQARVMAEEERLNVPFKTFFDKSYLPDAAHSKKPESVRKEMEHVKNWIHPVTQDTPMRDLDLATVKRIRAKLAKAGRSPRTQQYVFRTFCTVWNAAMDLGLVGKLSPTKAQSFRLPKVDNERERFLTPEEAETLLDAVKARSVQAHDIALTSLFCGLRFSEVAGLTWGCVDTEGGTIRVMNAKGDKARTVYMTDRVKTMLKQLVPGTDNELVFPGRGGKRIMQVPSSFIRAVADAKLNEGVTDPKRRFSFHGLRHSYASWLVQSGVDLYRVQRLLGHSTPVMTQRYGHLEGRDLEEATKSMERALEAKKSKGKVVHFRRQRGNNG